MTEENPALVPVRRDAIKKRSILETTLLVLPTQIVFRVGEAILPLLLAYWFGRNHVTDVYYFAWAVFAFAGSLVFSAFQDSALVPILAEERLVRPQAIPRLIGSLLAHTWVIGGAIAVAIGGLALGWFAIRYSGPEFTLAAAMVVPFSLLLVTMSTRTFFGTLLAVDHHFNIQPIASGVGMLVNVGLLATWHSRFGVAFVPVTALAGELVAAGLLGWFALRVADMKLTLCFERPPALLAFTRLIASELGGAAVTRINPVVDQLMAGLALIAGGGTMLRYTSDVATLPTSLLQAALLPVLLSHLADDYAAHDIAKFRRTVVRAMLSTGAILLAAAAILYFVRAPLLRFVFLRGEMDAAGVDRMIAILPYHLVGLAPFGVLLVLARAHIAMKNSGIMLGMGIINAVCNAAFNVVLVKVLGLEGIALSTSLVTIAIAIVFWVRYQRRVKVLAQEFS